MEKDRDESAGDRLKVVSLNPPKSNRLKAEMVSDPEQILRRPSIAVGTVLYNNTESQLRRLFASVRRAGVICGTLMGRAAPELRLLVFNNGGPLSCEVADLGDAGLFSADENIGFGAGHNRLMQEAFAQGCDLYVGVNPDGLMHPRCLFELVTMARRYEGKALIEAIQAPEEHPKPYDPLTLDTPWISGACFAISPQVYRETGGFDDQIFMYCEDVDLSWRVRLLGFRTKICPTAWFYHDTTNRRPNPILEFQMLISGRYLGEKWGVSEFRETVDRLILDRGLVTDVCALPDLRSVARIEDPKRFRIVDFRNLFSFSHARWT
jgi:GT2 family glycosyltransferase